MSTITVATVTNVRIKEHIDAIMKTAKALPYPCEKLIICPNRPPPADCLRWETAPEFENYKFPQSLNLFLIKKFADYINTDFVIYVHDDGFARNPDRWTDAFLSYDYIGAPWPSEWNFKYSVGNGGFSLRSRQLLSLCQFSPEPTGLEAEDVHICRTHHEWFEQHKCRFAPPEVAIHWSYESVSGQFPGWNPRNSFGFHGKYILKVGNQPFTRQ